MESGFEQGSGSYSLSIAMVAALGGLLTGYDTAVISGAISALDWNFVLPRNLSEMAANSLLGLTVSGALIGCVIGGAIAGFMANRVGRRRSLLIAAALFIVTSVGSATPELGFKPIGEGEYQVLAQFIFYRIVGGIGVGMVSLLSPLYIAEIAPAKKRGQLVSYNQLAIIIGMLVVYLVNYFVSLQGSDAWINTVGWRWMFGSEALPAAMFFVLLLLIPESPRWLMMRGRSEEALSILSILNGEEQSKDIAGEIQESFNNKTGKLFSYKQRLIITGIVLAVLQQFVGVNVVMYYGPEIFKNLGSGTSAAFLQTLLVGGVNFLFTIAAIVTVDKIGRKPLLVVGAITMSVAMIMLGFVFQHGSLGVEALACMLFFMAGFSLSWGPVVWILLAEIFPNNVRGRGMSIAVAAVWISNCVVTWTFPILDKSAVLNGLFHHGFSYWLYGIMALLAAAFAWKWLPETKGKTLEEMNRLWATSA